MPSADSCTALWNLAIPPVSIPRQQYKPPGVSRILNTDFQYTTAEFTRPALGEYGLRYLTLTRPALAPTYPVPVRRLVPLLHASFKPHLTMTPLRFATLHLHQVGRGTLTLQVSRHARHTLDALGDPEGFFCNKPIITKNDG